MALDEKLFEAIVLCRNAAQLLEFLSDHIRKNTGAALSMIYLKDPASGRYELMDSPGGGEALNEDDPGVAGRCILTAGPALDNEAGAEHANQAAFPLVLHGRITGLIAAFDSPGGFDAEKVALLAETARVLSLAADFFRDRINLDCLARQDRELCIRATDVLSPQGEGHVLRVARIAAGMAVKLDFSSTARERLWTAALYHDVGKIFLQGRQPWEIDRLHPGEGRAFLEACGIFREAAPLVEAHHERCDGTGFPRGLSEEDLPLGAWVLSLAEAMEEFIREKRGHAISGILQSFYTLKGESHHPLALEALTALIDSGNLMGLYEAE
ncbi:MAG: HD domain-containing protein [bacterium]